MNHTIIAYLFYLPISIAAAVWVGQTLHRHGRIFLVDAFGKNEALADAVNHLLLVGWYLINVGYVVFALKYGPKPDDWTSLLEGVSTKIGLVLFVLGAMHFFNLYVFARIRRRGALHQQPPPVPPTARWAGEKP
jgi:hypothetical protein